MVAKDSIKKTLIEVLKHHYWSILQPSKVALRVGQQRQELQCNCETPTANTQ